MYVAVVMVIFGQALLYADVRVAFYGLALCVLFHCIVDFVEEPHLRRRKAELLISTARLCLAGSAYRGGNVDFLRT